MKRISTSIAVLLLAISTAPVVAQETTAELIAKLGSGKYTERENAARALEKFGKVALPALRDAIPNADLETKRRAILVLEKIEDQAMLDEITVASPVRLQFKETTLDDALAAVEKQIGLRTGTAGKQRRDSLVTLDTKVVPFWQAWRRFCAAKLEECDYANSAAKLKRLSAQEHGYLMSMLDRENVEIHTGLSSSRIEFAAGPYADAYAVDDRHSVRVRLKWHALDSSLDGKTPYAVFAIELRAEPRLVFASLPRAEITKIVDDQGQSRPVQAARLLPETALKAEANFLSAYVGEIQYGGMLQLKAVGWEGPGRSLKEVHGRVRMEVKQRPSMLEIPAVLKAIGKEQQTYSGIKVKVLEAETTDDDEIHLRLRLDHLESLTPQTPEEKVVRVRPGVVAFRGAMDVAIERLELLDPTGRKCQLLKSRYEQVPNGKGYEAVLLFGRTGAKAEDMSLVMTKPARTLAVEIPFVVRDVIWTGK